jgi:hypothetical protein
VSTREIRKSRLPRIRWPDKAVEERPVDDAAEPYARCFMYLRFVVGILGIAVPIVLVFGEPLLFDGQPMFRGSVSAYYYSGMREVFVGSLCAIGVFLVCYKVSDRTWENWLGTIAGAAVILVALFPTGRPGEGVPLTPLQDLLGETWVERIHFVSATTFIILLAVISAMFARYREEPRERLRRGLHGACVSLILVAIAIAGLKGLTGWPPKGILIGEWLAVTAFGASWLVKGWEIRQVLAGKREHEPVAEAPAFAGV